MILKKLWVIHPFLFAIAPILFLFAYNIDEVPASDLLLPMLVAIIGTLILFFSLRLITKNYSKSGIITSYFLVLFFSYGYITRLIDPSKIGGVIIATFSQGLLWVFLFIIGAFLVIKSRSDFQRFTKFLSITAVTLIAISLINISVYEIKTINLIQEKNSEEVTSLNLNTSDNLPDIYYIILDEYARSDTLKELYNYDNSEFIDYLANKGFYIASRSRSNYSQTTLSLSSSLNMEYINYLSDTVDIDSNDLTILRKMLGNNEVSRFLKSKGYRSIYISSGFYESEMSKYAEVYRAPPGAFGIRMSNFTSYLIQTTALAPFNYWIGDKQRRGVLHVLDTLADMPDIKEPKFVFAHVNSPHPPFVFDRNGNPVVIDVVKMQLDRWQDNRWQSYQTGYVEQLIFINKKVEKLVDEILSKSEVEPIIIIQADTGSAATGQFDVPDIKLTEVQIDERMNIFNAYFLPKNGSRLLYDSITPVNTFRVVFNLYFDTSYDLLEDKSYFSQYQHPYKFSLIPAENNY